MSTRNPVLLVSGSARGRELVTRLRDLQLIPLAASDFAEAEQVIAAAKSPVKAGLIDMELTGSDLKSWIKRLCRAGPTTGITFAAFGSLPDRPTRKSLRAAGLTLGLWEPIDDGLLRFQVNRALTADRDEHGRESKRVPTFLLCRVHSGGRTKDAIVYSLSEGGAFLETPRASMDGAHIEIELRLPGQTMTLGAHVVFSNVPGNLQRPNLPLGMGVRFRDLDREHRKRIGEYVDERLSQLEL